MKYEHMKLGATFETRSIEMTREKILSFAQEYDHQPLHLDEEFARAGPFGDIVASGFQTLAVGWNLWLTHGVMESDGRGGISMDDCRWFEPVFPGDQLRSRVVITELRVTSKGRGFIRTEIEILNQHDRAVARFSTCGLHARRRDEEP